MAAHQPSRGIPRPFASRARTKLAALACAACCLCALTAGADAPLGTARIQLLGLNDFHGQLESGKRVNGRPAGGAAVLAAYLRAESAAFAGDTLIVHAGDHVGASPPASALLRDEPSIELLNLLANRYCAPAARAHPRCNLVGTPGNHEFDEGVDELLRLLYGGAHPRLRAQIHRQRYRGARFPYVSANVVDARRGALLLPPYVIKRLDGVRLGVIGAVLADTPTMVIAEGVRRLRFLPEADAINRAVRALRRRGVEAIALAVHQGGPQAAYEGPTKPEARGPDGEIARLIAQLDDAVDVVISGHAHAFTNALMANQNGHRILVAQALSAGTAYADIELEIDRQSGDVTRKSARIVPTYADAGPGLTPAADVAELVARAAQAVAHLVERVVGSARAAIEQAQDAAGESALGDLIADAQRSAVGAQIALMNQGGIRADLEAGPITWGELFAIQPFQNRVISMELTGAALLAVLEQQWQHTPARILQVSGLCYVWDPSRPIGARVVSVAIGGAPLAPDARYRVAVNDFLAGGSGGFTALLAGARRSVGPVDIDALSAYIAARGEPVQAAIEGRIRTR